MQYLVLFTCGSDDFPCLIAPSREKAIEYLNSLECVPESVQEVFGMDASYSVCVKLVEFTLTDEWGFRPTKCEVIKNFDLAEAKV